LGSAPNAVFGGAHLGYTVVSGHVAAGVEAEVNGASASGRFVYGGLPGSYAQNLFGSADARLGWVSGQVMVFALAGYAWSTLEGRYAGADVSASRSGYDVGAGLEYALTERFSWRIEYRYYDFGRENFGVAPFAARIADNVVRASVSYRFGGL
jgi:outer membrane immunogenic protein